MTPASLTATRAERLVEKLWTRLEKVGSLEVRSSESDTRKSMPEIETNGTGSGTVQVLRRSSTELIFSDEGTWSSGPLAGARFSNRWSWTFCMDHLELAHLRRGLDRPIALVELHPAEPPRLESPIPHRCGKDEYDGSLYSQEDELHLRWLVVGPRKNYELLIRYS